MSAFHLHSSMQHQNNAREEKNIIINFSVTYIMICSTYYVRRIHRLHYQSVAIIINFVNVGS